MVHYGIAFYLFLFLTQHTIMAHTAAKRRQHPAVIIVALPTAAVQSQFEKSEKHRPMYYLNPPDTPLTCLL